MRLREPSPLHREGEFDGIRVLVLNDDLLQRLTGFWMGSGEDVAPERQPGWQTKYPIRVCHREKRMRHHAHVGELPRVHVALEPDKDFRVLETLFDNSPAQAYRQIELAVVFCRGVKIVKNVIEVLD